MDQANTEGATKYLITLVHGTFARGAAWTREGSALHSTLAKGLGPEARLQYFDWSGKNTHKARLAAGKELAAFLAQTARAYPDAKRVTIAHSHGGNIALYARRHAPEPAASDHLVCLATPFILCQMRRRLPFFTHFAWIIACLYLAIFVFGAAAALVEALFPRVLTEKNAPYVVAIGYPLAFGLLYGAVRRYLKRRSALLFNDLGWSAPGTLHLLTVAYTRDEARMYLSVLDRVTAGLSRWIWQAAGLLFVPVVLYVAISIYMQIYRPDIFNGPYFSDSVLVANDMPYYPFVIGLYVGLVVAGGLVGGLLTMLRGNPYGYGWERPSTTMLLDIDATDVPEGLETAAVEHFRIELGDFGKRGGLAHSLVYEDARMLDKIVTWIKGGPAAVTALAAAKSA